MSIFSKIKSKLIYSEIEPLVMDDQLRDAYQTSSVVGGKLKGKTVLITGATSGIGLAIAERMLNEGCNVIISGRNLQKLDYAIKELNYKSKLSNDAIIDFVQMDQYNPEEITKLIETVFAKYKIDIVINNAGTFGEKDQTMAFRSVSEKEYFRTIDVNLKSTMLITELSAEKLAAKKQGNILNVSSICAFSRNHYYTPYGISKTGIVFYTKMIAEKYNDVGVIINSIAPGPVATIMNHNNDNDNISCLKPLRHVIIPEQIAALVAYMVGSSSKYLSGVVKQACATEEV